MKKVARALSALAWAKAVESYVVIAVTLATAAAVGWMAWAAVRAAGRIGGL